VPTPTQKSEEDQKATRWASSAMGSHQGFILAGYDECGAAWGAGSPGFEA